MTSAYATSLVMHRFWPNVASGEPAHRCSVSYSYGPFSTILRPLIDVSLQNQDEPTAYDIYHDSSSNQHPEVVSFYTIVKRVSAALYIFTKCHYKGNHIKSRSATILCFDGTKEIKKGIACLYNLKSLVSRYKNIQVCVLLNVINWYRS